MKKLLLSLTLFMSFISLTNAGTLDKQTEFAKKGEGDSNILSVGRTVCENGKIYVVDSASHCIKIFDDNGKFLNKIGSFGSGKGQLYQPTGVAIDNDGNMYVIDFYSIDYDPKRSALNNNTQLYHTRIQKFNSNGKYILSFGKSGTKEGDFLGTPSDIVVDKEGNVIVADRGNYRIQMFDSKGKFIRSFGTAGDCDSCLNDFSQIDSDGSGNIYVLDKSVGKLMKYDNTGNTLNFHIGYGYEHDKISQPMGFRILSDGSIAVIKALQIYGGSTNSGDVGKYYIILKVSYFDLEGKFIKYSEYLKRYDSELNVFSYKEYYRSFMDMDTNGNIVVYDLRNHDLEKYSLKDTFMNLDALTKTVFIEGRSEKKGERRWPESIDNELVEYTDNAWKIVSGINTSYRFDDKNSFYFSGGMEYGRSDVVFYEDPVMFLNQASKREFIGANGYMNYTHVYDLNENKRISLDARVNYDGNIMWYDPDHAFYHNDAHAIFSRWDVSSSIDIVPNLTLTVGNYYYFWADYYNDEDFEHPTHYFYGRLTGGF